MFRRLLLLALVLCFAFPFAHADEASKRAKIDELFTIMKMSALMDQVMTSSMKQGLELGKQMFGDKPLTSQDQKILDNYVAQLSTLLSDTLAWKKLKPGYIDLYALTYTESEVDGILAFYKSPSGIAMVQKTPQLLAASQELVMSRMQEVQSQLQEISKAVMEQITAAHKGEKPSEP